MSGSDTKKSASARPYITEELDHLKRQIESIVEKIKNPESPNFPTMLPVQVVQALHDHELLALDAWTEGKEGVISAECDRRRVEHEQLARRFASRGEVEFVPVLAERVKQS